MLRKVFANKLYSLVFIDITSNQIIQIDRLKDVKKEIVIYQILNMVKPKIYM